VEGKKIHKWKRRIRMKRKEREKRWWEKFEAVGKHDIYFPLLERDVGELSCTCSKLGVKWTNCRQ
jgi:hypothetical protein